ncbi:FAD-binding oxidoreductase [Chitinophaga sp. RCC_12]|uniref:FAD-binding oxidoreductase n=1 Tax=Chitinophaga sp. RCC_12 TaxID=3239226 RepID=UPI003524054E
MTSYKQFEVIKKVFESKDVVSLYMKPVNSPDLPVFRPGQHLMFKFHIPGQEIPAFRYYSFSDHYNNGYYRISVKKERILDQGVVRAGLCSSYIFDIVKEGDYLEAKGPAGEFYINAEEMHPLVLIAGGIGITPLLSMLKTIAKVNPQREVYFFYGVNQQDEHSFLEELSQLKKTPANFNIYTFYNHVLPGCIEGLHYDYTGFITVEKMFALLSDIHMDYYICGPAAMMQSITGALEKAGVSALNIHTESFSTIAGVPEQNNRESSEWIIEFTKSGKKLLWDQRYRSILEFAEANDIDISSGCLFGDCGTCLTKLQQGEIKYIHPTMVQPGKDNCLPCSCVPSSHLVLDA